MPPLVSAPEDDTEPRSGLPSPISTSAALPNRIIRRCRNIATAAIAVAILLAGVGNGGVRKLPATVLPQHPHTARLDACAIFCGDAEPLRVLSLLGGDSKALVDRPLAADPEDILASWSARFPAGSAANASHAALRAFLEEHTHAPGTDTAAFVPADWVASPPALRGLANSTVRSFAHQLCDGFLALTRRVRPAVRAGPQRHTLLPVPHTLVVPGGRFGEAYGWDSYWIVRGLLLCGMAQTARGVVLNHLHLVAAHGFVPNGGRTYYLTAGGRSQPPLLTSMVRVLSAAEGGGNMSLLAEAYPLLAADYAFWLTPLHTVVLGSRHEHALARYATTQGHPRPESYAEDVATAAAAGHHDITTPAARALFADICAAAESGWDFSRRWLAPGGTTLADMATSRIVPVELNALLHRTEGDLAAIARMLAGNARDSGDMRAARSYEADAHRYADAQGRREASMEALMWSEAVGRWEDVIIDAADAGASVGDASYGGIGARQRGHEPGGAVTLAAWAPLLFSAPVPAPPRAARLVATLLASGLIQEAGVAATTYRGSEQWDGGNAWAPLVLSLVEGLRATAVADAHVLAADIAKAWVASAYLSYVRDGYIHEKMSAAHTGFAGGGGEVRAQHVAAKLQRRRSALLLRFCRPGTQEQPLAVQQTPGDALFAHSARPQPPIASPFRRSTPHKWVSAGASESASSSSQCTTFLTSNEQSHF